MGGPRRTELNCAARPRRSRCCAYGSATKGSSAAGRDQAAAAQSRLGGAAGRLMSDRHCWHQSCQSSCIDLLDVLAINGSEQIC